MAGGRPTKYSETTAAKIASRLAGGESLRAICRDPKMPAVSTVLLWVVSGKHPEFSEQYTQARTAQGYFYADSMLHTVDELRAGDLDPQSAKVIMDAYKWTAERNAAKAYGPKQALDHTSSDGSMTPKVIERVIIDPRQA